MTIAACHVSPEGVVLGADSTTTFVGGGPRGAISHLDHAQKLFEIGASGSTLALVTWGQGQVGKTSHRSRAAQAGQFLQGRGSWDVEAVARFLLANVTRDMEKHYASEMNFVREVTRKDSSGEDISEKDLEVATQIRNTLQGGYCVGGRHPASTGCSAWSVEWGPLASDNRIRQIRPEVPIFWGVPDFAERLIYGVDSNLLDTILKSGKWTGTSDELLNLAASKQLIMPEQLPIREAIDWIHTILNTTIRALKFAKWPHYCGGDCEIGVVTTDRPFRWVRHKPLDAAIGNGGTG